MDNYSPEEERMVDILLDYWLLGLVSPQSVSMNDDEVSVDILWHAC